jgi:PmbA protein
MNDLHVIAADCLKEALAQGASDSAVRAWRVRDVTLQWRDGKVEKVSEATTRGMAVQLYVDGRYSSASTSDLRKEALTSLLGRQIELTRALAPDPDRILPDPALYAGRADVDLQLADPAYAGVTPEQRRALAQEAEEGARSVEGARSILSVTSGVSDTRSESVRLHSNGFEGQRVETSFWVSAEVSVKDPDGRRPEEWSASGARFAAGRAAAADEGRTAARRALARVGASKAPSDVLAMVVENRSAGRLVSALLGPMSAYALQQRRSFLDGRVGEVLGSETLHIVDDPLIPKALGSRLWDAEGLAAKPLPLFERGVLKNFYVDTYYGRKLGLPPTTSGTSNLSWSLGDASLTELLARVREGIFVTGFLGGNSNSATGDFSFGVQGFRIRAGALAEPVAEMNIAGNQNDFWKRLIAVGNDPYPYSALRTPTLVFEGVQFAGA